MDEFRIPDRTGCEIYTARNLAQQLAVVFRRIDCNDNHSRFDPEFLRERRSRVTGHEIILAGCVCRASACSGSGSDLALLFSVWQAMPLPYSCSPMLLPNANLLCSRAILIALSLLLCSCNSRKNAVSGTIEVDEAHVGPRMAGRVEKILAQEGDRLKEGQTIAQLEANELRARRELAAGQIDTAMRDADAAAAQ